MNKFDAHILVVDDDDRIRDLIKQYLTENNFLITTANSAEDAKKKVSIIKFDLIILDIMMPGKTGLEFTIENKDNINTPIILLTAKGEASERIIGVLILSLFSTVNSKPVFPGIIISRMIKSNFIIETFFFCIFRAICSCN